MRKIKSPIKIPGYLIALVLIALLLSIFMSSSPVLAAPVIIILPSSGAVGTTVNINGSVFDSYKGDNIHIFFDTTEIPNSPLLVPDNGAFSIDFTIPAGASAGKHWIEVRSETASSSMLAKNYFIVDATTLTLDTQEGNVGATINIAGSGFYVNKAVTLYYVNILQNQIGTEIASAGGQFSHRFIVPAGPAGFHNIIASNEYGNRAEVQFKVLPKLTLSLDSASAGDLINASGTGFAVMSPVIIVFGSIGVTVAQTDNLGSFEIEFNIPPVKPMSYDVRAQDSYGNTDTVQFTVTAGANLSQTIGATGTELTVNGSGFIPGHTITVYYDDIAIATVLADNNGDFTATFTVPPGGGSHVITVSDGTNTKNYTFTLEKEPPPLPVLLLPKNKSITKAEAFFDWQDVIDASVPVTYNLEIASDINFASRIFYKAGINASQYTLNGNEILSVEFKNAPYYWRVKAIDGAGNESEYSEPWVFYVSVPTTPALFLPVADVEVALPVHFSWESVASLSPPVTYYLQIAPTPDFASPLFNKTGLSSTEYLATEDDDLRLQNDTIYFWRVKAIDNAGNAGGWSATGSFRFLSPSGFPLWATCILIIIGFFIAILIAFRAGRRTAYH